MKLLNLRESVRRIHSGFKQADGAEHPPALSAKLMNSHKCLSNLRQAYEQMYQLRNSVGRMPPGPNTRRARIGALLVATVQRMLFWYTPQIRGFHIASTAVAENVCLTFDRQMEVLQELMDQMRRLELELRVRLGHPSTPVADGSAGDEAFRKSALDVFQFQLRSKRLDLEEGLERRLRSHLEAITNLEPAPPAGPWLDLGCDRGRWCVLAGSAGFQTMGVEENSMAAKYCRDEGIEVEQRDYLEYLRTAPDQSFAVISAFHILERHPFPYVFELVWQAARVLKSGGLLVLETADPTNILNCTNRFWLETTHLHLLPSFTTEALLGHFGFHIVSKRLLAGAPEEAPFPWGELELVQRLNQHFYGPQDYAVIGRFSGVSRPA